MAVSTAEGNLRTHWIKYQSTFDTIEDFAATDACRLIEMKLEPTKNYEKSKESCGTATLQTEIAGKRGGKWSVKSYVKPNTAGTPPDIGEIIYAGFGIETSSTYTISDTVNRGLQLQENITGIRQDVASGAWVEQIELEATGGQPPIISASGGYARHCWATSGTVGTAGAIVGATTIPLTAGMDGLYGVGGVVTLEGASNTNRTITAVTPATPSITIDAGLTTAVSSGNYIIPYIATPTVSGTLLGGVEHSLTIGGTSYGFISAKVNFKTGIHGLDKEATADRANRLARGPREITGEIQFYFLDQTNGILLGKAWDSTTYAISLRIGPNTSNQKLTVSIPVARLEVVPLNVPDSEEATFTAKFVARQSAAACDEMSWTFA